MRILACAVVCCLAVVVANTQSNLPNYFGKPALAFHHDRSQPGSTFGQRHPKLKKALIIGGIGAATGGIGAAVMGGSVVSGAAVSAGTDIGAHEAVETYKAHKQHKEQMAVHKSSNTAQ